MKPYPLQALLEVRENERDDAQAELASAIGNVSAAAERVRTIRDSIAATQSALVETSDAERTRLEATFDLSTVGRTRDYERAIQAEIGALESKLERAQAKLRKAKEVEDSARAQLMSTEKELRAVEKHYQDWQAERRASQRRKAASEMDEVALSRWKKEQQ